MLTSSQDLCRHYQDVQTRTASQGRLVLMLYEGAINFIKVAEERIAENDIEGKGLYLGKARRVIAELRSSLDFEKGGEIAINLERLYAFLSREITKVNMTNDSALLAPVLEILANLEDGWKQVVRVEEGGEAPRTSPAP